MLTAPRRFLRLGLWTATRREAQKEHHVATPLHAIAIVSVLRLARTRDAMLTLCVDRL